MSTHLEDLVTRLCSGQAVDYSCDVSSSSVRIVKGPVPAPLALDLAAIAALLKRDAGCLAGDLLAASIQDAVLQLPPALQQQLAQVRATLVQSERDSLRDVVEWNAGGT